MEKNKGSSLSQTIGLFCKDLWYLLDTPSLLAERMGGFFVDFRRPFLAAASLNRRWRR